MLRYESFSCYNHGEYLSHSRDIFVEEKNGHFAIAHFVFSCMSSARLLGKYIGIADQRRPEKGRLGG